MKGNNRYKKKSFGKIFAVKLIKTLIAGAVLWSAFFTITAYFKGPVITEHFMRDTVLVTDYLEALPSGVSDEKISDTLNKWFPNDFDKGRKGLEKSAVLVSRVDKDNIIAVSGMHDDSSLTSFLRDNYKEIMDHNISDLSAQYSRKTFPSVRMYTYIDVTAGGKSAILVSGIRVNYFVYFSGILTAAGILIIMAASGASVYFASKENIRNIQDDYRRGIINSLSHDLKTPLTIISGCAENLKENVEPEKREYYENTIIENAEYTRKLIDDALELTRSEKGSVLPAFENVSISGIISELLPKYKLSASEKNLTFSTDGECCVRADRRMMSQLLENLISNSVKYSDENGSVSIMLSSRSICVSNDFSGRTDVSVKKLTEPFVRGNSERSGRNGSGLGLAIAKNIANIHRFRMTVVHSDRKFTVSIRV